MFGTLGLFVRNLSGLHSIEIGWFRFFFGALFLSFFLIISRRGIESRNRKLLVLNGLSLAIWFPIYVTSLNLGAKLGNAAFLLTSGYIFSVAFSWLFLREPIEKRTLVTLLVSILGVALILKPLTLFHNIAEILALVSGALFGLNFTISRKSQQINDSMTTIFYLIAIPAVVLFPLAMPNFKIPSLNEIFYLASFGLFATALPTLLLVGSLKYLKTFEAGIPALLEPVTASIVGWLAFNEILDFFSIIGGALVGGSSLYQSTKGYKATS